jgi:glyceraldehyde 3-phosphate dehydrogenase
MAKKVAINGFGRIGRLVFRQMMEDGRLEVAAINDIAPLDNLVYLLAFDSVQKNPAANIKADQEAIMWENKKIPFSSIRNPAELPWDELGVDIVVEASGVFTEREAAAQHLEAGASRVIVTAPSKGADLTVCMGVNEDMYKPEAHQVLSNASCTTNCLAPVAKVLDERFGIVTGFLTTVHAYTSSQAIVDAPSKKWRRGRAGAVSIVPTTTGAAIATTKVLPQLEGKLDGLAMRVPVPVGSIIDFVVQTEKPVNVENVNNAFREASQKKPLKGILGITEQELVSADIVGTNYSSLVDAQSTMVLGHYAVKVLSWYDNEWGFAHRVVDLANYVGKQTRS